MSHNHLHISDRLFEYRATEKRKLILSLVITVTVMAVEVVGGLLTGSIALISDAGHMFTHAFAIGLGLAAIAIARKPLCHHRTFGLFRAEILAAFVNGLFLLLVAGVIVYESVERLLNPQTVLGKEMLVVAMIGLVTNVASILILHGSHKKDLNVRSVFFHMMADAASSVGIVIAAILILKTGWTFLDPIVSIGISAAIVVWAWSILRESTVILLEMAPGGLNVDMVSDDLLARFPNIESLDNVHLWAITADMLVFSAHIRVQIGIDSDGQSQLIHDISNYLSETYHIIETTLQVEVVG